MQIPRKTGLIIIAALIIAAIIYGFLPKPVSVETVNIKKGYMKVDIEEEGRTRVMNRFIVSAPVAGYALRINLNVGDLVNKGDAITQLEPLRSNVLDPRNRAAAEASIKAAKANALAAKADSEFAQKELDRTKALYKDGLVSEEKLDAANAEALGRGAALRSSEFSVEVAQYELEAADTALKYSTALETGEQMEKVMIKSPVSGYVLKVNHESEGVVQGGEALVEIGDPKMLEVEVDVLSADAVRIRPGTPVLFERWGGESPLKGKVRVVEPTGFTKISALGVEEQRVLVISDIISPPEEWKALGDGYRVEAGFILWEAEGVLQVPSSALFRYDDGWAVFVMKGKKALLRKVDLGRRNGLSAQVISGLIEGDTVITHPDSSIKNGTSVTSY
ncbi:macrolide export protein MacA [bacterium BMS3Abin09]|nr:macrolide export protein MacA [bacterium BMS3Abin09]HDH34399.1 efflux RND transporter periplasmic adaptor subunit [Nitrospirota bacterium]HDN95300.1 efflux RND transporter periplasmic adaptor subunit [Nitrospirota bacterium]HDO67684.1 efflux RND transporter periplasmic adaptor subunit [Nitrospirota bacterium]HEW81858.1 efflux RND transporter periplasmic adaptor subunit [Nitrospirota bacterium]